MHTDFTVQIFTIYFLYDDFLRAWGHKDDPQARMSTAEVMTVALTASALFHGNQERSCRFLLEQGYIKAMFPEAASTDGCTRSQRRSGRGCLPYSARRTSD